MARRRSRRSGGSNRKRESQGIVQAALGGLLQAVQGALANVWPAISARIRQFRPELAGAALLAVALFTLVTLISPDQGLLSNSWLRVLSYGFGWGMALLPLLLGAVGLWLLLRRFETELPAVQPEQAVGAAMLVLGLLVVLQAVEGRVDWPGGLEAARAGRGGGAVGTALLVGLLNGFGPAAAAVLLLAWLLVGAAYLSGHGPSGLLAWIDERASRLSQLARRQLREPTPQPAVAEASVPAGQPSVAQPFVPSPSIAESEELDEPKARPQRKWKLPDLTHVLEAGEAGSADRSFDRDRARLIEETLQSFGAPAKVVEVNRGPTITQFGVEPDFVRGRGGRRVKVKVSKISSLADDLALALAAPSIRIEAPVPGKGFVGIEVPNPEISLVALRDVMESKGFERIDSRLRLGFGRDVSGVPVAADLASMPHLLIAGATGSGKSVCINAIIACLLLQNTPEQLRMIMIDPKRVELTFFNGIPHLLAPVIVELDRVVPVLGWISREMDERYRRFAEAGVRNIADYNRKMRQAGERALPYLVLIVDELADLMMMAPDETERVLTRLAQLARATGIHLVIATQRPSVDVVTGLIKANFPSRIAFAVASSVDSRVILDQPGAERLLGRGDMLFQAPDAAMPKRVQGVYVSEPELLRLIRYWKVDSIERVENGDAAAADSSGPALPAAPLKQAPLWEDGDEEASDDDLYGEAVALVRRRRRASISMLQRRLRIGYTRAARLIDTMEQQGIVGPEPGGSKAREVLDYGDPAGGAAQ